MKEKSLLKNSGYNILYKLLNIVFPLISVTYVSHIIGATGIGNVASAQNIAQYFVVLAALGIPNYGIREISKVKYNGLVKNRLFSELFILNFVSTILFASSYYIIINKGKVFTNEYVLYNIAGLLIILNIFNVDWFYHGIEEFSYIAKRSFFIKICSVIILLLAVKDSNDYIKYVLIQIFATAGNYIFNIIHLKKHNVQLLIKNINVVKHLKSVLILLCTVIAIELYTLLDTTMLMIYCENENIGYYTNTIKLVKMVITVVAAVGGVLLPRLSYYFAIGHIYKCAEIVNRILNIMIYLLLPCGSGLILVADLLVPVLFGVSFNPAISTLKITALLIYTLGFSNLFGTQVLLTFNCEKKLFLCTLVGAITNIVMNFILIPLYQQNGAAAASVVSELIVTVMAFNYSAKYISYHIDKKVLVCSLVSVILMNCWIVYIKTILSTGIISLIVMIISGGLIYIFTGYLMKNPIYNEFSNLLKRRKVKN